MAELRKKLDGIFEMVGAVGPEMLETVPLDAVLSLDPDVVVLDISMPVDERAASGENISGS